MEDKNIADAISRYDVEALKNWLANTADPNTTITAGEDHQGANALQHVLMSIDGPQDDAALIAMTRMLIEKGADVNAVAVTGDYPPLYWAVTESRPALAKLLLEAGAIVDYRSDTGDTLLVMAMDNDCDEMVELLTRYCDAGTLNKWGGVWCNTPLGMAFRKVNLPMIELLLRNGADPYAFDPDMGSAIHNIPPGLDEATSEKIFSLIEKYKKEKQEG